MELFEDFSGQCFSLCLDFRFFLFSLFQNFSCKGTTEFHKIFAVIFGHQGCRFIDFLDVLFGSRDNFVQEMFLMGGHTTFIPIGVRVIPLAFIVAHIVVGKVFNATDRWNFAIIALVFIVNKGILDFSIVFTELFIGVIKGNINVDISVVFILCENVCFFFGISTHNIVHPCLNDVYWFENVLHIEVDSKIPLELVGCFFAHNIFSMPTANFSIHKVDSRTQTANHTLTIAPLIVETKECLHLVVLVATPLFRTNADKDTASFTHSDFSVVKGCCFYVINIVN